MWQPEGHGEKPGGGVGANAGSRGPAPASGPNHAEAPLDDEVGRRRVLDRLDVRLFLLVAAAIIAITLTYDAFRLQRARDVVLRQLEHEAALVAQAVEGPLRLWMGAERPEQLERLLRDIREAKGATCVGIYGPEGTLDFASRRQGVRTGGADDCPSRPQEGAKAGSLLSRWSPLGTLHLRTPLLSRGTPFASLEVVLPSSAVTDPLRRELHTILVRRGLFLVAIGIILWGTITVYVSRPIRRLIRQAAEVGRGNLEARLEVGTRTEIGDLARAFNRMAANLQESQERRVALERQVRHADKLAVMGKLASEVAHEVGTPLNVISGRARLLRRHIPDGDPRAENLDIIRGQVDRIGRVLRRFLAVGRPPGGQQEWVHVAAVLREVASFVEPEFQKKRIHLQLATSHELPRLKAMPDALFQVALNLVMNAAAAVSRGGRIEVVAFPAGSPPEAPGIAPERAGIEVQVRDDGHGIDPAILPRVFDPFVSTRPGEGTGLGLSICRDIVRDHGGWIGIESLPGKGTTVRFWLPLESQEVTHAPAAHPDH